METITMEKRTWKMINGARAGKDECRDQLKGIHFTNTGELVATNGKMLVKLDADQVYNAPAAGTYTILTTQPPASGLKGFVDVVLAPMDEGTQYPDYERVIPEPGRANEQMPIRLPESFKKDAMAASRAVIQAYQHTGNAYNAEMFCTLGAYNEEWTISKAPENKAARLEAPGCVAVIMPFYINV